MVYNIYKVNKQDRVNHTYEKIYTQHCHHNIHRYDYDSSSNVNQTLASNRKQTKVHCRVLIKPTFTAAAYHKSFYKVYFGYSSIPLNARKNITSDLNLLSSQVTNLLTRSSSASSILYLTTHLRTPLLKSSTHVLTDEDVDGGSIFFVNGSNKYDILILGHQEYVTKQEYD